MELNPVLTGLRAYPFARLQEARAARQARGEPTIDFSIGEPREPTPAFIRQALIDAIAPQSTYPLAVGLPALRAAVAAWTSRRFGALLDPDTQIVPTLGSKEAIFHLAQVVGPGAVAVTTPGYPVGERSARFAGRAVIELPLGEGQDFLPDLHDVDLDALAILWVNYPNNPTAHCASAEHYERWAALARKHDFVLASDEAYSELYFGPSAPASALQASEPANVLAFNTLSKRSSMPGYRVGFVAGDPQLIAALKRYRPNVGVAPQEFVQRAAIAAYADEQHVIDVRATYAAKRALVLPALRSTGLRDTGGDATFFLWLALPAGWTSSEAFADALIADAGILVTPGAYLGDAGEGYVRVALVPTLDECAQAVEVLSRWRAAPR
jgi:succinyldiaminopimelate transaminase